MSDQGVKYYLQHASTPEMIISVQRIWKEKPGQTQPGFEL